jgi:lipoprotein-anchoring transpeptidase ErfK/SrfK
MGTKARTARRLVATIALVGGLAALSACGGGASWHGAGDPAGSGEGGGKPVPVAVTSPANGATDVPTSTEITLDNAKPDATVTITDAAGETVPGTMRPDGRTWLPGAQLKYGTAYTATVTGEGADETSKVSFTTMAKPGKLNNVSVAMADGKTYGVAMPVVVRFGRDVAKDQRANIEKRLFVTSTPAQVGVWHWFSDTEVHYRPKEYWQSGTQLSVRLATGGLPMGSSAYGNKDVTVSATIGRKLELVTDDATHQMTVIQDGQVVKTVPVSLGKASTPSSSGPMVIMDKNKSEVFRGDPSDPYEQTVYYVQRTTTGGQYIHAAPWSEGDQGKRNVSHGCTNVSQQNAIWLYDLTLIGDLYTVKGTPRKLAYGDGWTDWAMTWDEYVKGSALPAPAETAPSTGPSSTAPSSPAPSASTTG